MTTLNPFSVLIAAAGVATGLAIPFIYDLTIPDTLAIGILFIVIGWCLRTLSR